MNEQATKDVPRTWKVGDVIADLYEVTDVLGEGAFGIVHKVHHRGWNMDLAVKSPKEEILANENAVRRFLREAETWVKLGLHPHIASCYYVRVLGGLPRMFIEYADAGTLRDWMNDGKVKDWHTILDIAIQICYGLSFAHKKGLVHRDLKPGNCLMMSDGTLKLTDFGIVKLLQSEDATGDMTQSSEDRDRVPGPTLTGFGRMGTPEYMAPEQWHSPGQVTAAADIWAFGVILYEMICGRRPFELQPGEPLDAFYARMVRSNWAYPNPRKSRSDVHSQQVALMAKCLAPKPETRFSSIDDIAAELDKLFSLVVEVMPRPVKKGAESLFPVSELDHGNPQLQAIARRPPPEIPSLADTLNNQAVSMLDLGREEEAERLLDDALKLHPGHLQATYNRGTLLWRAGRMTDTDVLTALADARTTAKGKWAPAYITGLVQMERADIELALPVLVEALELGGDNAVRTAVDRARSAMPNAAGCVRTFEGHGSFVQSVCLSADNRWALSGSSDRTLRLWDAATGKCVRIFEGHRTAVRSVCLSADNRWALSSGWDKTPRLWDVATGKCIRVFEGHGSLVQSVCFSADGNEALTGSADRTLRLWDVATANCIRVFEGQGSSVQSVCLSADGRYALAGSLNKTLRLWNVATGRCIRVFEGHDQPVWSVSLSADGRRALSGSIDWTLRLWDVATGQCIRTFKGHNDFVNSVSLSADGRWALSGSLDKTVRLWDVVTGRCVRTFEGHGGSVNSVCLSTDGRWALSGSEDETLRLWRVAGGPMRMPSALCQITPASQAIQTQARFDRLLREAQVAAKAGRTKVSLKALSEALSLSGHAWEKTALDLLAEVGMHTTRVRLLRAVCQRTFRGHTRPAHAACLSADGRRAISGGAFTVLRLWDVDTPQYARRLFGTDSGNVNSVCLSADGCRALSGGDDKTLRLWDADTGEWILTFEGHSAQVSSVSLSADNRWALSGSVDRSLKLWNLASGECIRTFEGHSGSVNAVCLSADGRWALSGSSDKTLRLWDVATGKCVRTLEGHIEHVLSVCLSADNRCALSGSADKTVKLWDLTSGKCIRAFEGHSGSVNAVCLCADGRWALSGSHDKTLRLWDVATGKCVRVLEGHSEHVLSVCISADGRWALSSSWDKTLRLWELVWEFEAPDLSDWDEEARPYLETFLTLHTRVGLDGFSRIGKPVWSDEGFKKLLVELGRRGYGWLRPEGVRRQLEKMMREWKGPPALGA